MKTVTLSGGQPQILDVPAPRSFDNYAVVRIHSAPMCTEYRKAEKGETCSNLGHEAAGEVVETFPGSRVGVGQRVIVMPQYSCGQCHLCLAGDYIHCTHTRDPLREEHLEHGTGTYAEYVLKPDWLLLPVPDDIAYDEAAMACCGLGPALGAGQAMNIRAGDVVLVSGLGPVGLGAVIYCTYHGARVIGVSRSDYRRALAQQLGAEWVLDPASPDLPELILASTDGRGTDQVIECAGEPGYQQLAFEAVKRKGQIAFIGESGQFCFHVSNDLLRKGITLHGIWHWNLNLFPEMIDLIRGSKEKIARMITHFFPMEQVHEAFRLQSTANCGKVILRP